MNLTCLFNYHLQISIVFDYCNKRKMYHELELFQTVKTAALFGYLGLLQRSLESETRIKRFVTRVEYQTVGIDHFDREHKWSLQ